MQIQPQQLQRRPTEDTQGGVAGVQRRGVVADGAFVHPLQSETGSEDGQREVPADNVPVVPTEAVLDLRRRFSDRGDVGAVARPEGREEGRVHFVPVEEEGQRHVAGQRGVCIWADLYFTWRRFRRRKE